MTISRDNNLLAVAGKLLERVQKLFLHAGFAIQETDVVDNQNVDTSKPGAEARQLLISQSVRELVSKTFGRHEDNLHLGILLANLAIDRFSNMRLSDSDATMNIERTESFTGVTGHLPSRRHSQFVAGSLNKTVQLCETTPFAPAR